MKCNVNIPDKIYIQSEGDYYISDKWSEEPDKNLMNNQYVRTGMLMGWLDEMIEVYTKRNGAASQVAALTFKLVRAKIETL